MFTFGTTVPQTVDGVLEVFRTAIDDLKVVATVHQDKAAEHDRVAAQARSASTAAQSEAQRACSIASKMEAIFQ
jgi:hypothetical protein